MIYRWFDIDIDVDIGTFALNNIFMKRTVTILKDIQGAGCQITGFSYIQCLL